MGTLFSGMNFMTDDGQDELGALSYQRRRVELPARRVAVSWWAIVAAGLCVLQVPMACVGIQMGRQVLRHAPLVWLAYLEVYGFPVATVLCGMVGSWWIWRSKGAVRGRRICRLATWGGLVWLGLLLWLSTQHFGNTN